MGNSQKEFQSIQESNGKYLSMNGTFCALCRPCKLCVSLIAFYFLDLVCGRSRERYVWCIRVV